MELHFDPHRSLPLYGQIYEQIRQGILQGRLPAGSRLPASRQLAEQHGLARVTVTAAYDRLRAEGYVVSRTGAGTYVAEISPADLRPVERAPSPPEIRLPLSQWGQRVVTYGADHVEQNDRTRVEIDFGFGRSFPHIFPYDVWRRLLARYLSTDDAMLSRYGSAAGFEPLRRSVAGYLGRLRGVHCAVEQVVIVSGVQQALDILARLLLNPSDEVLVETPGYADAFDLLRAQGACLTAVPVDEHGFPPERIPPDSRARLAFVTPSNQFPRGGTMPLARRLALLEWAEAAGAMIIEDDYDSELRYSGHPLAALQGLDEGGRVIYLGTFSKVLFPALRLGYVVLPEPLLTPFLRAKGLMDRGAPTLMQAAV
ncbi:MAG: PLP-dependent aminotransferase family protein, partial [Chloroflexota bacterium]